MLVADEGVFGESEEILRYADSGWTSGGGCSGERGCAPRWWSCAAGSTRAWDRTGGG